MYSFSTELNGQLAEIEQQLRSALKEEGFGIITEIDVKATMKEKLDIDKRPYKILGACNPTLANQAIDAEPDIGLLLPCNVVIRLEESGAVRIAFMDPVAVLSLVEHEDVEALAGEVRTCLLRVRESMGGTFIDK
ncbi:MAG: DUF302 domain-containing protein [Aestuariibacter sp.]|nr:DUF302 domain-containing protein [Aestuariibacter sp.]